MSQTIISILQILPKLHKRKWTDHIKKLVFACNYTKHPRTGYSPYFLLFGRPLKLSINVILPKECNVKGTYKDCINKWKEQVKESHKMVSKQGKKKNIQHTETVLSLGLQPGDRVLVRNMFQREGTGKIRDFWEEKFMLLFQEYVITG